MLWCGGGGSHQARARPRHQDPDSTVARAAVHVLQLLDKVLPTVAAAPAAPKEIVALADAGEAGLGFEDRGLPGHFSPALHAASAAAPARAHLPPLAFQPLLPCVVSALPMPPAASPCGAP